MLDQAYEKKCVDELKKYPYRRKDPWPIPGDVEKHFQMIMGTRLELGWEVPSVRVVMDEEGILAYDDLHMRLRCFPCEKCKTTTELFLK